MTDCTCVEQLSVAMTTKSVTDVADTTTAADVVTSSSRGVEFYFQCAVVVIGIVGTAANALILYAMVASKQHKKLMLIFNQNVLDVFSCLFLIITYTLKLCNIHLTGSGGYWFCMFILSDNLIWSVVLASKANIVVVTIERYLKTVYPIWSKQRLRNWMTYVAMACAWISGYVHSSSLLYNTSDVIDGVCYAYVMWKSRESQLAYGIFYTSTYYVVVLLIFIFCYWRILLAIRRQASVMAGHSGSAASAMQTRSNQIQSNVIKTMILVSAFYAVSDLPSNIFVSVLYTRPDLTLHAGGYHASMFCTYLYFCVNPFIYATKFDPVKRSLVRLIPFKKNAAQTVDTIDMSASRISATNSQARRLNV